MSAAATTAPQHIVPLADFVRLRRPHESKAMCNWNRDARAGKIPGAFQFQGRGPWFVNLDTYDEEVRKLSAPKTPSPDTSIESLAEKLGLSPADLALVREAAGA